MAKKQKKAAHKQGISRAVLILCFALAAACAAFAAEKAPSYMTYGDGWVYFAADMPGWAYSPGDTRISSYYVLEGHSFRDTPALIYFRVIWKKGRTLNEMVQDDIDNFESSVKGLAVKDAKINSRYKSVTKTYYYGNKKDYVSFIDPGKQFKFCVLVCMNSSAGTASKYEPWFFYAAGNCGTFMTTQFRPGAQKSGANLVEAKVRDDIEKNKLTDSTGVSDIMVITK